MQEQSVQLEEILRESQNLREQVDGTATARTSLLHARYTTATAQLLVQNAPAYHLSCIVFHHSIQPVFICRRVRAPIVRSRNSRSVPIYDHLSMTLIRQAARHVSSESTWPGVFVCGAPRRWRGSSRRHQVAQMQSNTEFQQDACVDKQLVLRLEAKVREAESRFEFEQTSRHRAEVSGAIWRTRPVRRKYVCRVSIRQNIISPNQKSIRSL